MGVKPMISTVYIDLDTLTRELKAARIDALKSGKRVMHDGWIRTVIAVTRSLDLSSVTFNRQQFLEGIGFTEPYNGSLDGSYSLPVSDRSLVYGTGKSDEMEEATGWLTISKGEKPE